MRIVPVCTFTWLSVENVTHIVMEATGVYWKPVWNILSDGEFELVLGNAVHIKSVPGRKIDVKDAAWLADLMAHGLVSCSFVPDQTTQEMRDLSRSSFYYRSRAVSEADLKLMRQIDELHLEHPFAGSRLLRDMLAQRELPVVRKHVRTERHRRLHRVLQPATTPFQPESANAGAGILQPLARKAGSLNQEEAGRGNDGDQKTISTLPPPRRRLRAELPLIDDRKDVQTIGSTSFSKGIPGAIWAVSFLLS
jgi:hypothetical protein